MFYKTFIYFLSWYENLYINFTKKVQITNRFIQNDWNLFQKLFYKTFIYISIVNVNIYVFE